MFFVFINLSVIFTGFTVNLSQETMEKALNHVGCFIAAATSRLCPADKMMYRVRDITSTVDNINLIACKFLYPCITGSSFSLELDQGRMRKA